MKHGTVINYLEIHGFSDVEKLLYHIAQASNTSIPATLSTGLERSKHINQGGLQRVLADFGLSMLSDTTSLASTNRGGNSHWMAPELLDPPRFGLDFLRTLATDVYALDVCVSSCTQGDLRSRCVRCYGFADGP
ncbi:hypothetical protein K438DRAFT_114905 [Mycena galopus ATCC 62051]|nr:hypothetical protein K438DRAFT_114905 [Mycena galopus ATCC 62051]